jgi:hypothetical protein|tara:strand:- start:91 stop:1146 length:1056 start_codon:yes stop_codon:yes gene_type:complete
METDKDVKGPEEDAEEPVSQEGAVQGAVARKEGELKATLEEPRTAWGVPIEEPSRALAPLYAKMAAVMGDMADLEKRGENQNFNYKYVTADDLVGMIRPLLAKHGLVIFPRMRDLAMDEVKTKQGSMTMYWLSMDFEICDTETGLTTLIAWKAQATDGQDKGLRKAMTSAKKDFLITTFLASAGEDDPDADHRGGSGQPAGSVWSLPYKTMERPWPPAVAARYVHDLVVYAKANNKAMDAKGKNGKAKMEWVDFLKVVDVTIMEYGRRVIQKFLFLADSSLDMTGEERFAFHAWIKPVPDPETKELIPAMQAVAELRALLAFAEAAFVREVEKPDEEDSNGGAGQYDEDHV